MSTVAQMTINGGELLARMIQAAFQFDEKLTLEQLQRMADDDSPMLAGMERAAGAALEYFTECMNNGTGISHAELIRTSREEMQ